MGDEKRGQGVVKMLNGNNFDSVVMKRKTHVMVFIYIDGAPNNEECMRDFWQLARNHKKDRPKVSSTNISITTRSRKNFI